MGAPMGPPLLYSEAACAKRLSPAQMAATCHPSTQYQLPKAEEPAEGCRVHAFPKSNSPPHPTKRVLSSAQTSSNLGETPNSSQARLGGVNVLVGFSVKSKLKAQPCSSPAPPSPAASGHLRPDTCLRNAFYSNFVLKGVWGSRNKCWHRMIGKQPCKV